MNRFTSVLVANRGEIAVRVLRSAAAAGYRTIAVYSEADAQAPHVRMADEAVLIGPSPAQDSYLNPERVLAAAARTGATAIHPGYGFLSENADFARACANAGITFIGPSPEAIELMGNKAAAKRRMLEAGVPCVPGYQSHDQTDAALVAAANDIGVPLMVKAAAGGGGRGMRLVEVLADLPDAIAAARSEAMSAFASDELILEKAVLRPRHVEIQVMGDSHGGLVYLGERDCSVQRRHQKVIEESPCPALTDALRSAMGQAAVNAARSIDYLGAGTVEFLLDESGEFYFLEMNTRLQVEHPVTECVTGLDLVDLQFQMAQGGRLPFTQADVTLSGHAIEARLYAEDVAGGFLPASGMASHWSPAVGEGVRVDHGLASGLEVSPFYDPMIAKVIANGPDRETARRRLLRALQETEIFGVDTNREFLLDALRRESFIDGRATTAFIAEEYPEGYVEVPPDLESLCLGAVLDYRAQGDSARRARVYESDAGAVLGVSRLFAQYAYVVKDRVFELKVCRRSQEAFDVRIDDALHEVVILDDDGKGRVRAQVNGMQGNLTYELTRAAALSLHWRGRTNRLVNVASASDTEATGAGSGAVLAPMHGSVLAVHVAIGDAVAPGDELGVMEAMKMEHRIRADVKGTVTEVHAQVGQQLAAGVLFIQIETDAPTQ